MTQNNTNNQPTITPRQSLIRQLFRGIEARPRWDKIEFKFPILFHRADPDPVQLFATLPLRYPFCTAVGRSTLHINRSAENGGFWSAVLVSRRVREDTYNVWATIYFNPTEWERTQRERANEPLIVERSFRGERNLLPFGPPLGQYRQALELALTEALGRLYDIVTARPDPQPLAIEQLSSPITFHSFGPDAGTTFVLNAWVLKRWETYIDLQVPNAPVAARRAWSRAIEQFSEVSQRAFEIEPPTDDALRATREHSHLMFSTSIETTYDRQVVIYAKSPERIRYEVRWRKPRTHGARPLDGQPLEEFKRQGIPGLAALLNQHPQQALHEFRRSAAALIADTDEAECDPLLIEELRAKVFASRYSDETKIDAFGQLLARGSYLPGQEAESQRMENYLRRRGVCLPPLSARQPRQASPRYQSVLRQLRDD